MDGDLTDQAVAGYIAKYATKAAERQQELLSINQSDAEKIRNIPASETKATDRAEHRQQWMFFALGALVSIPIGVALNPLVPRARNPSTTHWVSSRMTPMSEALPDPDPAWNALYDHATNAAEFAIYADPAQMSVTDDYEEAREVLAAAVSTGIIDNVYEAALRFQAAVTTPDMASALTSGASEDELALYNSVIMIRAALSRLEE
ncbi:hypothetical protein Misp01_52410 [Microtetraspora sp. NBRC 13810]|nr:hypothetical protein [Microtetraspora sp. NBRC 13810]GLW10112.1 hypothetical protein Misp01_52410 [Microtetraspora sp. NBRC 13810]